MKQVMNLNSLSELDTIIEKSNTQPVLLFKHSSSCPLSVYAFRQLMNFLEKDALYLTCGVVIVQRARHVSNEIASRLNVVHESPQVILIENGRAVWHESHNKITAEKLRQYGQKIENK
jgi:bacillithiol system protein YtxJ